jgi:hypothetical protein
MSCRPTLVFLGLALAILAAGPARPADAQGLLTGARRIGLGGLSIDRTGNLRRYNAAYRAVPARVGQPSEPKLTIPVPLGLVRFFRDHPLLRLDDDPTFNPNSPDFNAVEIVNLVLNPPLPYDLSKRPAPTRDAIFTSGRQWFLVDLGEAPKLVPDDPYEIGGTIRPLDPGFGIGGLRVSVMGWAHDDVTLRLGDTMRGFLSDADPLQSNTRYSLLGDANLEFGFAPTVGFAGRLVGNATAGLYLGGALHYYLGVGYAQLTTDGGLTTGNTIVAGPNPVTPDARGLIQYAKVGRAFGHGTGGDVGAVLVAGPIEIGVGVNDIGATIIWPDTRRDSLFYRGSGSSSPIADHLQAKTTLPVSYLANVTCTLGSTTLGADALNGGLGTTVHVGAEHRISVLALRGGVARDPRRRFEFGYGAGLRLGTFSIDAGAWTHTNALSSERAVTMVTSLSIY